MQNISFHQLAKGTKLNNTLKLVPRLSKAIPALLLTKFIFKENQASPVLTVSFLNH